jgi:hypothetical protein
MHLWFEEHPGSQYGWNRNEKMKEGESKNKTKQNHWGEGNSRSLGS